VSRERAAPFRKPRPHKARSGRAETSRVETAAPQGERLQKVLAAAGLGSRRKCEALIRAGRVEVDRVLVTELGTRVDRDRQQIRVDGQPLTAQRLEYHLVNKPEGVVCTNYDPSGRPRVIDLCTISPRASTRWAGWTWPAKD